MPKCDLTISLDGDAQALRPGDSFSGYLTVGTDADVRCNALTLELRWVTDGKGDEDSKVVQSWDLFSGDLRTGARQSFPFAARLPRWGPATYRGKILQVEWELRARADVPWAIDPKTTLPLLVGNRAAPGAKDDEDEPDDYDEDDEDLEDEDGEEGDGDDDVDDDADLKLVVMANRRSARQTKIVVAVIAAIVVVIALAAGMWRPLWGLAVALPRLVRGEITWSDAPNIFLSLLILGIGGAIGWAIGRQVLIKRRLGDVHCEIAPDELRPGDEVTCFVRFTPQSSMEISRITARLRATEHCEKGSGKSHRTYDHVAIEQTVELSPGRAVSPGHPYEARGSLHIPGDAPISFWASDNRLEWEVLVAIQMPRFPDWTSERTLSVRP